MMMHLLLLLLCSFASYSLALNLDAIGVSSLTTLAASFQGKLAGVCSALRPGPTERGVCGDIDGDFPFYLYRSTDFTWSEVNANAANAIAMLEQACLPKAAGVADAASTTTRKRCLGLFRDFVCRLSYAGCNPLTHEPDKICYNECLEMTQCIAPGSICARLLPPAVCNNTHIESEFSQGAGKLIAPPGSTECQTTYKHLSPPPALPTEHREGCTLMLPSPNHKCARGEFISLDASFGDMIFSPDEMMLRISPHGTDPNDGSVPTIVGRILSLHAVRRLNRTEKGWYVETVKVVPLPKPTLTCLFTEEKQELVYWFDFKDGSRFKIQFVVFAKDTIVDTGDGLTRLVPAGMPKFTYVVEGNPFGDLPADATHSIIAFQVRQNRIPYAFNENDVGDVTTWEVLYAGGGRLNVEFLGYAMVDGERRSVLVSVMDESITDENRNGDDLCPQVPMPVMLPISKKTLFYDPSMSFILGSESDVKKTQRVNDAAGAVVVGAVAESVGVDTLSVSPSADETGSAGVIVAVVVVLLLCLFVGGGLGFIAYRKKQRRQAAFDAAASRLRSMQSSSSNGSSGGVSSAGATPDFVSARENPSTAYRTETTSTATTMSNSFQTTDNSNNYSNSNNHNSNAYSTNNYDSSQYDSAMYNPSDNYTTTTTNYPSAPTTNNNNASVNYGTSYGEPAVQYTPVSTATPLHNDAAAAAATNISHYGDISQAQFVSARHDGSGLSATSQQLYDAVATAITAGQPTPLAAAVKALVLHTRSAAPRSAADKSSAMHAASVALGRAARDAVEQMKTHSLDIATRKQVTAAAHRVAELADALD